uniref:uncharacterized protein LOC122589751 n=1 Tax=Erigeron canadensis TaxID=72917 RepID=UPI001CB953F6|nr:uncharacterized protein LOC122589751 [Erigeron canadensis]
MIYTLMAANDDAQNLFDQFDTYWFTHQIFKKTQNNPFPQTHINNQESIVETDHKNFDSMKQLQSSDSPNSVLNFYSPKLETIFSGKESREILLKEEKEPVEVKMKKALPKERKKNTSSSKKSKSLSELEFEELKGFMDLGFMFSEEDKDSKLVSIIPGLQRLGKLDSNKEDDDVVSSSSRPYLSEAWDNYEFDNKRELIRIPAFGNEVEIKDQLKCWAHSVAASVVR